VDALTNDGVSSLDGGREDIAYTVHVATAAREDPTLPVLYVFDKPYFA